MKHPTRNPSDAIKQGDTADETTIILGVDNATQETAVAPQANPEPARASPPQSIAGDPGHTRILRPIGAEPDVRSDPVVGWLVVLDGPGKGNFRPIFSGSNTIGRSSRQRIPIDYGDDAISSEKQAFIVYDGRKRQFQLVPNLERPNLVHHNDSALLANGELKSHDKITMGRTTLLFVPLCGPDFDWSETK